MKIDKNKIKEHPLDVLNTILPFNKIDEELYKSVPSDKALIRIEDKEPDSKFYFEILEYELKNGIFKYHIRYSPRNKSVTAEFNLVVEPKDIKTQLDSWVRLISEYSTIQNQINPIIRQYEEEFFTQYKILDDDAETKAFDLDRQILFDDFLANAILILEEYKSTINDPIEIKEVEELREEAKSIRKEIPNSTKQKLIKKIGGFYAKMRKTSLVLVKEIFIKIAANALAKVISG